MPPKKPTFRDLVLPESLRSELQIPLGELIQESELEKTVGKREVYVVGDIATLTVVKHGITPRMVIVDFKTKRAPRPDLIEELREIGVVAFAAVNAPGTLSADLQDTISRCAVYDDTVRIEVEGEEDLAALPVILHAKEGSVVIYGMPDKGLVVVTVGEASKARVRGLLARFESADQAPSGAKSNK